MNSCGYVNRNRNLTFNNILYLFICILHFCLCIGLPLIYESCNESKTDTDKMRDRKIVRENGDWIPHKEGGIRVIRTATATASLPQHQSSSSPSSSFTCSSSSSSHSTVAAAAVAAAAAASSSSSSPPNTSTTRPMLCGHCNVQVIIDTSTVQYSVSCSTVLRTI